MNYSRLMGVKLNNDSTTPGYLTPTSKSPAYDEDLERQLSAWVRSVSGLPAAMVRPRWTSVQPSLPAAEINWCGFGITGFDPDAGPAFVQRGDDSSEMWRHEVIECMASFYGPSSQGIASQFRDGIGVSQNNETLATLSLSLFDYSKLTASPELINNQWVRRYDVTARLRRKIIREYGIKSLVDAPVTYFGE